MNISASQWRRVLLGSALVDRRCAELVAQTSRDVWPDGPALALRDVIARRIADGEPVDVCAALDLELTAAGVKPSTIVDLSTRWAAPDLVLAVASEAKR
jgi:hypothetical protein